MIEPPKPQGISTWLREWVRTKLLYLKLIYTLIKIELNKP